VNVGYNLRPMELSGAMGLVQLPKLAQFVDTRRENSACSAASSPSTATSSTSRRSNPRAATRGFGFPIRVKGHAGFTVTELTKALNAKHVRDPPIIAGNIARQPALKLYEHRVVGDMKHSNA